MSTWLAALIAVAAITVTYFSCVRPHLRGRGQCAMTGDSAHNAEIDRQVAQLPANADDQTGQNEMRLKL